MNFYEDNESIEKREEDPKLLVLEPDHPMMQRFQIALKNHLLKQIEKLSGQINELVQISNSKKKEKKTFTVLWAEVN